MILSQLPGDIVREEANSNRSLTCKPSSLPRLPIEQPCHPADRENEPFSWEPEVPAGLGTQGSGDHPDSHAAPASLERGSPHPPTRAAPASADSAQSLQQRFGPSDQRLGSSVNAARDIELSWCLKAQRTVVQ